jgi:hypothetical protein
LLRGDRCGGEDRRERQTEEAGRSHGDTLAIREESRQDGATGLSVGTRG